MIGTWFIGYGGFCISRAWEEGESWDMVGVI